MAAIDMDNFVMGFLIMVKSRYDVLSFIFPPPIKFKVLIYLMEWIRTHLLYGFTSPF